METERKFFNFMKPSGRILTEKLQFMVDKLCVFL